ncbi:MAG: cell division protein FtsZ, partial [Janthinobacterium lividum]
LELSPIPNKVQLGASLTEGMGAGSIPEVGKNSAIENIDDIKQMLGTNTKMLFITAGMGGGTGTGASPIIAQAARELDILTVGIITTPFSFEGKRRKMQAEEGMEELRKYVDSFLVISNDRLREIFGNLTLGAAFAQADDILTTAAKGIAEIITLPGYINVDFKDVRTVMKDSGVSIMGSYSAAGENRAYEAVRGALASPLLKDNEIEGARYILLNISSGSKEVTMDEVSIITDYIQEEAGLMADLIWGNCQDENLGEKISVTIIATGFQTKDEREKVLSTKKVVSHLITENPLVKPVNEFTGFTNGKTEKNEPFLKVREENHSGVNMFQQREEPIREDQNGKIRYQLTEEDKIQEPEIENSGFTIKYAEQISFDKPAEALVAEQTRPESVKPEVQPGADDQKTDESIEEQLRKSRERIMRLKDLSMKLRSGNIQELENVPAYKRKEVALQQNVHSSETQISRFSLLADEDGKTEIRPNNSFLHDNVD